MGNPRVVAFSDGMVGDHMTFIIDNATIVYSATETNGSAVVGRAVSLSAAKTIQLAADAEPVVGKLVKVEADNTATVQVKGVMILPGGNAANLTLGKAIVGAASAVPANGYIREVNTAAAAELGVARGFIIDAGTATAVAVCL